jgi:uncharacterized protein YciI
MRLFVLIGRDGARGAELRKVHREAHLSNLGPLDAAGRERFGGRLVDESNAPCGSVIVFEAEDLEAAREFARGDPYVAEGIFERYEVMETRQVFPR